MTEKGARMAVKLCVILIVISNLATFCNYNASIIDEFAELLSNFDNVGLLFYRLNNFHNKHELHKTLNESIFA